jgi:hypothetical protein
MALMSVCLLIWSTGRVSAQSLEPDDDFNKGARTSLQFLKIGIGARQAAMGEASIAIVRDVNSVFWNPANIAGIEKFETSFSYVRWLGDMNYVAGALGYRLGTIGIVSGYLASLDYGEIPEALVTSGSGNSDTRTGNSFSGNDFMAGLTFAREFTDRLSIGLSGKYIHEGLFTYSASTFAWDVGTNYDLGYKGIRLAMSAQNFGGAVEFLEEGSQAESFDLPIIFRIGLSMNLLSPDGNALGSLGSGHAIRMGVEAINTNDFNERFHVGGEYTFNDFLAVRAGYRMNYEEGNLALGFGVAPEISGMEVRVDYAYVGYEFLDAPHRFSLTLAY